MPQQRQPEPRRDDASLPTLAAELWDLVRAYFKQETVEPMKGVGRFVAFGVAGSVCLGIGLVLLALAGLRALQSETGDTFQGSWTWAPYLIVFAGCLIATWLFALRKLGTKDRR